jgi:hypothetical protein
MPDDDRASIARTFRYARRLGLDSPIVQALTPYPRIEMREAPMAEGLVTNPDDLIQLPHGERAQPSPLQRSDRPCHVWEGMKLALLRNNFALFAGPRNRMFRSAHTL